MKKFIIKSYLFFGLIVLLACTLFLLEESHENTTEYLASMTDKHQRIKDIKKQKMILAGGSNLVFGIDSQQIENEFNIPVINLGLHAKLGLAFILNELKDVAKPKDIIILSIEHLMTVEGDRELQTMTSYYNPFAYKYYHQKDNNWSTQVKMKLDNHHMLFKKIISNTIEKAKNDPVYTRNGLNKYGDGVNHLGLIQKDKLGSKSIIKDNKDEEIRVLNDFYSFAKEKGIEVVFSYGAYEASEYEKNMNTLKKTHKKMKQNLNIEMIMDIDDFVYPTSYFYDSVYHLNQKGRSIHTKKMIQKLKSSRALKSI
ncbi:hypothetical protein [Aquimarina spinulae]|uniref:hypothetical protein n=1 Tax=Aquimarina spinulae TaxID=1192023 RepID=UPI000D54FBC4|nr:hypothetical protein [Aquimarina spinulae]